MEVRLDEEKFEEFLLWYKDLFKQTLERLDTNGDKTISQQEQLVQGLEGFDTCPSVVGQINSTVSDGQAKWDRVNDRATYFLNNYTANPDSEIARQQNERFNQLEQEVLDELGFMRAPVPDYGQYIAALTDKYKNLGCDLSS